MGLSNFNILTAICKLLIILMVKGDEIDRSQCLSLGFTPDLMCSSCDKLSDFNLDILEDDCRNCCQPDSEDVVVKKYSHAVLEVCGWKLGRYPQVQAFIKSDRLKSFPNVKVKYVRGKDPTVLLLDENREVQETLSVEKWDTDNIEEFFAEKLKL